MLLRKKEEIEAWLNQHGVVNYELIEDKEYGYVVNVSGSVYLYDMELKKIEIKFNEIYGSFNCSGNQLKSLEGCPNIVNGNFFCFKNELETLEDCPEIIKGSFDCSFNKLNLEGLKYLPQKVNTDYIEMINNDKIKEFGSINSFLFLKEKVNNFLIKKEKEKLLNDIHKEKLNINTIIKKI